MGNSFTDCLETITVYTPDETMSLCLVPLVGLEPTRSRILSPAAVPIRMRHKGEFFQVDTQPPHLDRADEMARPFDRAIFHQKYCRTLAFLQPQGAPPAGILTVRLLFSLNC